MAAFVTVAAYLVLVNIRAGTSQKDIIKDNTILSMILKLQWPALLVVIILAIMSLYSIAVMVERWITFKTAGDQSRQLAPKIAMALRDNRIDEAIALTNQYNRSHLAEVVKAGLKEIQEHQFSSESPELLIEPTRQAITLVIKNEKTRFRLNLSALGTIGKVAPLIGFIGTIFALIFVFRGAVGADNIGELGEGISMSLTVTALGLLVGLSAWWAYNVFVKKVERFEEEMKNTGEELIEFYRRRRMIH